MTDVTPSPLVLTAGVRSAGGDGAGRMLVMVGGVVTRPRASGESEVTEPQIVSVVVFTLVVTSCHWPPV